MHMDNLRRTEQTERDYERWSEDHEKLFWKPGNQVSCRRREPTPRKYSTYEERYTIVPTYLLNYEDEWGTV